MTLWTVKVSPSSWSTMKPPLGANACQNRPNGLRRASSFDRKWIRNRVIGLSSSVFRNHAEDTYSQWPASHPNLRTFPHRAPSSITSHKIPTPNRLPLSLLILNHSSNPILILLKLQELHPKPPIYERLHQTFLLHPPLENNLTTPLTRLSLQTPIIDSPDLLPSFPHTGKFPRSQLPSTLAHRCVKDTIKPVLLSYRFVLGPKLIC